SSAQVFAGVRHHAVPKTSGQQEAQLKSLKEVIQDFKTHYKVDIVYFNSVVENIRVSRDEIEMGTDFEQSLSKLLNPHGLTLVKGKKGGYVIARQTRREKVALEEGLSEETAQASDLTLFASPSRHITPLLDNRSAWIERAVKGTVTDESGQPLPGVTVLLKNTDKGTATGIDGQFQLNLTDEQYEKGILVFSFIGYETHESILSGRTNFDVQLSPSVNQLDQVVVVGYSSKKARYLSSSVTTITNEKLRDVTSNELSNLLQGKAPGVVVSSGSGDPTSAARVVIRGAGSISAGTSPLYVVDGNINGTYNPVDVESVTVLKDVAATGLYGSRAANGVIIVNTKTGTPGKTVIRVNNTLGFAEATTGNFRQMDSYQLYDFQKTFYDRDPSVTNINTNWWDLAFRRAFVNNHNLSVSGGSERTTFYVSANYYKEQGTIVENDKTGYNLRTN